MKEYPTTATERFDEANFHIKYTLSFLKISIKPFLLSLHQRPLEELDHNDQIAL